MDATKEKEKKSGEMATYLLYRIGKLNFEEKMRFRNPGSIHNSKYVPILKIRSAAIPKEEEIADEYEKKFKRSWGHGGERKYQLRKCLGRGTGVGCSWGFEKIRDYK